MATGGRSALLAGCRTNRAIRPDLSGFGVAVGPGHCAAAASTLARQGGRSRPDPAALGPAHNDDGPGLALDLQHPLRPDRGAGTKPWPQLPGSAVHPIDHLAGDRVCGCLENNALHHADSSGGTPEHSRRPLQRLSPGRGNAPSGASQGHPAAAPPVHPAEPPVPPGPGFRGV